MNKFILLLTHHLSHLEESRMLFLPSRAKKKRQKLPKEATYAGWVRLPSPIDFCTDQPLQVKDLRGKSSQENIDKVAMSKL